MEAIIRAAVKNAYDEIGRKGSRPLGGLDFPTGFALAKALGYPEEILSRLPCETLEGFVGAAPLPRRVLAANDDGPVLDCGAGAGVDSFWLALEGREVFALEASMPMIRRLKKSAALLDGTLKGRVRPLLGNLPHLPLASQTVSFATMNGVANLVPEAGLLLRELERVLKPGGTLLVADILALSPLEPSLKENPDAWAWCVGGAKTAGEWGELAKVAGFEAPKVEILEEFAPLSRAVLTMAKADAR